MNPVWGLYSQLYFPMLRVIIAPLEGDYEMLGIIWGLLCAKFALQPIEHSDFSPLDSFSYRKKATIFVNFVS